MHRLWKQNSKCSKKYEWNKEKKADHTTGTVKIEAEDGIEESKIKEKIENIGFDVK